MSKTKSLPVKDLSIDLHNFRTVAQKNELDATKAMISISPDYFWGLMESLLEDGYLPTENIIVLEDLNGKNLVKEGNRRVASVKIITGLLDFKELYLPDKISERINGISSDWIKLNSVIPCAVYKSSEADIVDRIVTRTHGKGQKAGRDVWEAVARARHNKIINNGSEPALDILEKYLSHGENITDEQRIRWAGKYNLTVLDEAIKKIASRFEVASSVDLANNYPKIIYKKSLDNIVHAIGMETLTFPIIRKNEDFALEFGIPALRSKSVKSEVNNNGNATPASAPDNETQIDPKPNSSSSTGSSTGLAPTTKNDSSNARISAVATTDERSVKRSLRTLKLPGNHRSKIETLRKEILNLKLKDNPIAFCFLLRSMFELSAKAYCIDNQKDPNAPKNTKPNGYDKQLSEILRDIVAHLSQNGKDIQMVKVLHGAVTEIEKKSGILSVTSMNHLVHNSSFTIIPSDIPPIFSNIFPLLEQMNK